MKENRIYEGARKAGTWGVMVRVNGQNLNPRFDIFNHSPDGFEWGYGGSGPAQLALAILADYLGDDKKAASLHQDFKRQVISHLPRNKGWALTGEMLDRALRDIEEAVR